MLWLWIVCGALVAAVVLFAVSERLEHREVEHCRTIIHEQTVSLARRRTELDQLNQTLRETAERRDALYDERDTYREAIWKLVNQVDRSQQRPGEQSPGAVFMLGRAGFWGGYLELSDNEDFQDWLVSRASA